MTDLRTLRPYLDALADETLRRALDHPQPKMPRRRTAWLVATAATVAIGLLVAVTLIASDDDPARIDGTATRPPTTTGPQRLSLTNPECIRTDSNPGCARTADEASAMLGFDVATPTQIPDGWAPVRHVVRVFPADVSPNNTGSDIGEYSQVWAPDGLVDASDPTPTYFQLLQRSVLPTDACDEPGGLHLDDGTLVCGTLGTDSSGVSGAFLWFVRDGVFHRVMSIGLSSDRVMSLLHSLPRA